MTKLLPLLCSVIFIVTGCNSTKKVNYDHLEFDLSTVKTKKLYLALLDHRSQIIDGSQQAQFIGTTTNLIGIKRTIENNGDMIEDFSVNIINSLKSNKIRVYSIDTHPSDSEAMVNGKLFKSKWGKKALIVFDDFYTKGFGKQILHYNFRVMIYDNDNMLLVEKKFEGKKKLGGSIVFGPGKFDHYLPESVVSLFETLFKQEEIAKALN